MIEGMITTDKELVESFLRSAQEYLKNDNLQGALISIDGARDYLALLMEEDDVSSEKEFASVVSATSCFLMSAGALHNLVATATNN